MTLSMYSGLYTCLHARVHARMRAHTHRLSWNMGILQNEAQTPSVWIRAWMSVTEPGRYSALQGQMSGHTWEVQNSLTTTPIQDVT